MPLATWWSTVVNYYRKALASVGADPSINSSWSEWVWPLSEYNGNQPVISDGWHDAGTAERGGCGHFGVDIMHRRRSNELYEEERAGNGKIARGHIIYKNEPAILCANGKVYDAENTGSGHTVRVSHRVEGRPILAVYRHLKDVAYGVEKGAVLPRGAPVGRVSDNPSDSGDPPHLHFELWDTSLNDQARVLAYQQLIASGKCPHGKGGEYLKWVFNPAQVMRPWRVMRWSDKAVVPYSGSTGGLGGSTGGSSTGGIGVLGVLLSIGLGAGLLRSLARKGGRYA